MLNNLTNPRINKGDFLIGRIDRKGVTGKEPCCLCDQVQVSHKWPGLIPSVTIMQIQKLDKPATYQSNG